MVLQAARRQGHRLRAGCGRSGFCVSIAHAEFMAARFNEAGIPARAVTSRTRPGSARGALEELRDGEVNILFTVDLFNEGVDVPAIDTVLFLRPDRERHRVPPAARPRAASRRRQAVPHRARLHRQPARRVPLRSPLPRPDRCQPSRPGTRARARLPDAAGRLPHRAGPRAVRPGPPQRPRRRSGSTGGPRRGTAPGRRPSASASSSRRPDSSSTTSTGGERRRLGWPAPAGRARAASSRTTDDAQLAAAIGRMLHLDDQERLRLAARCLANRTRQPLPLVSRRERRLLSHAALLAVGRQQLRWIRLPDGFRRLWDNPWPPPRAPARSPTSCSGGSIGSPVPSRRGQCAAPDPCPVQP